MKQFFAYTILLGLIIGLFNLGYLAVTRGGINESQDIPLILLFYIVIVVGFGLLFRLVALASYESTHPKEERQRKRREAREKVLRGVPRRPPKPAA